MAELPPLMVDFLKGQRARLATLQQQIAFFEVDGHKIYSNGVDTSPHWLENLHRWADEAEELIAEHDPEGVTAL